jgi:hypothetical protein
MCIAPPKSRSGGIIKIHTTRRHVVLGSHADVAVIHIVREISIEVGVDRVEGDITWHSHIKPCDSRQCRHRSRPVKLNEALKAILQDVVEHLVIVACVGFVDEICDSDLKMMRMVQSTGEAYYNCT